MNPAILCNYRQKTPSRIARMFLNKNGQPANSKPKPRESALKPPGSIAESLGKHYRVYLLDFLLID
jgi:hypothetical protein